MLGLGYWIFGDSMKDVDEIIAQTLAILRRKPIDGYEIYLDQSSHFDVESKEGRIDTFQVSHSLGVAFRILKRQRIGFSYTTFSVVRQFQSHNPLGEFEQVID